MTTIEFINKSKLIHNNKFTYTKSVYINSSTKVTITCPTHGDFEQVANSHLRGHGCKKCTDSTNTKIEEYRQNFINKAKKKFPNLEFDDITWVSTTTPIEIKCPVHGNFTITPNGLLHDNCKGCPECVKTAKRVKRAEDFKSAANTVHGGTYDYSLILELENKNTTVPIICKKHGVFNQVAKNHLNGSVCHSCMNIERGYKQRYNRLGTPATLYFVYFKDYDLYKLGVTVDIKTRFNGEPYKPEILFSKEYQHEAQAYLVETQLFRKFYKFKYQGDPVLTRKGNTELLTDDIVSKIIPSVEIIESTEEFIALTGSE